jgi:diguanylate cyclase (GGDEF)-like protein/PAS domain S-box-containing protein
MTGVRSPSTQREGSRIIGRQLKWLALTGTCGLFLFASLAFIVLLKIEVNGPVYQGIRLSNDLVADYVAPSESLLETALTCAKLADAPDEASRHAYEEDLKTFRHDYDSTHAKYMARVPEGPLKALMRGEAHATAQEYFKLEDQLIALVEQDRADDARRLVISTMNPLYDRHAAAVDQIVVLANEEVRVNEALAARSVGIFTVAMVAIGLLVLLVVCVLSWTIARGISVEAEKLVRSEESLRDREELYRSSFDQAAVGILHVLFDGVIERCNARFAEIVGYTLEELPGKTFEQFTPQEYLPESREAFQRLIMGGASYAGLEKPYLRKDGTLAWVKLTGSIQRDGNGEALHVVSFMEDITARKAAEERLSEAMAALQTSESRYRTVFQASRDALSISDLTTGRFIEINQAFVDLMGFEREEVIGRNSPEVGFWVNPIDRERVVETLRQNCMLQDERIRLRNKGGEEFWALLSASVIEIDGVVCMLGVTRDISDAQAAEDEIRNLAFYDRVTGLPNRRLLLDRLLQTLSGDSRSSRKTAVLFINLDDFKTVNDTLGHQIGDLLLREVAQRLTACVHESDTVARFGGDEFVVILEGLSESPESVADEAKDIGEAILASIGQTYSLDGHECKGTTSVGITVFGDVRESPNDVLRQAAIAMQQAKSAGGNAVRFFAPVLQTAVNARAAMKADLNRAILENQFVLYYQPQVDATGLIGAEALIRWKHPVRGLVPPNDFIPLAEETGLILALGDWAFETACRLVASWADRKLPCKVGVAVNISSRQFSEPDFVANILATLARTGANPKCLKLELTESLMASNIGDVIAKMTVLKSHGLSFSLDDFGTGYSSLSYLKRLPLDQLKIDRAFVSDILDDVASAAIAQTIVSLGRAMGLTVIAEGVETEAQHAYLASLGTDSFQGYLFSRPLPLEEFERVWLGPWAAGHEGMEQVSASGGNGTVQS